MTWDEFFQELNNERMLSICEHDGRINGEFIHRDPAKIDICIDNMLKFLRPYFFSKCIFTPESFGDYLVLGIYKSGYSCGQVAFLDNGKMFYFIMHPIFDKDKYVTSKKVMEGKDISINKISYKKLTELQKQIARVICNVGITDWIGDNPLLS